MSLERQEETSSFFEIDPSVNDLQYKLVVDTEKLESMINGAGISPDALEKTKVVFLRKSPPNKHHPMRRWVLGAYNKKSQRIEIYLDTHWVSLGRHIKKATQISDGIRKPNPRAFTNLLTTRRLSKYLAEAPKERSLPFAGKLLRKGFERKTRHTVAHEVGHAVDFSNRSWKDWVIDFSPPISLLVSSGLAKISEDITTAEPAAGEVVLYVSMATFTYGMLGLMLTLGRRERQANNLAKKLLENPEWQDFLSIQPIK